VLEMQEELMIAMDAPDSPFILFPFNTNGNIYTNIVKFGALHTPTIINMIGMLITTHEATINGDTVIQTAFLYTQMACSINSHIHSAYFKMLSVFLKTCSRRRGPGRCWVRGTAAWSVSPTPPCWRGRTW